MNQTGAVHPHAQSRTRLLEEVALVAVVALEHVEQAATLADGRLDDIAHQHCADAERGVCRVEPGLEVVERVAVAKAVQHRHRLALQIECVEPQGAAGLESVHQVAVKSEVGIGAETWRIGAPLPAQQVKCGETVERGVERPDLVGAVEARSVLPGELAALAPKHLAAVAAQAAAVGFPVGGQVAVGNGVVVRAPAPAWRALHRCKPASRQGRIGRQIDQIEQLPFGHRVHHMIDKRLGDGQLVCRVEHHAQVVGRGIASGTDRPELAHPQQLEGAVRFQIQREDTDGAPAQSRHQNAQLSPGAVILPPQALPIPAEEEAVARAQALQTAPVLFKSVKGLDRGDLFDLHARGQIQAQGRCMRQASRGRCEVAGMRGIARGSTVADTIPSSVVTAAR